MIASNQKPYTGSGGGLFAAGGGFGRAVGVGPDVEALDAEVVGGALGLAVVAVGVGAVGVAVAVVLAVGVVVSATGGSGGACDTVAVCPGAGSFVPLLLP